MYLSLVILQDTGLYVRVEFVCHSGPGYPRNKGERLSCTKLLKNKTR